MPEYLRVKVTASAKRELVTEKDGVLVICVREPREANMANHRVLELIANKKKISVSKLRLVRGHTHSQKLFCIMD
jgi:uncharacterized protein YggU (UPF0235/DUF167 family)